MTTDTTALQERIEAALIRATDDGADRTEEYAAAALPIIAAEVRAAKAEALREAAFHAADISKDGTGGNDWFPEAWAGQVAGYLEARATEYETGGRA